MCNKTTEGSWANLERVRAIQPPIDGGGGLRPLLNGVNLQPSYYHGGDVDLGWGWMQTFDTPGKKIKSVRIEIEAGQETNASRWIQEANTHGYSVIATYHSSNYLNTISSSSIPFADDEDKLLKAAEWWKLNYDALHMSGPFYVNLMNEWGQNTRTAAEYASAYNAAIKIVRNVYTTGPIIIDLPNFGHDAATAAAALTLSSGAITDSNIILSAHIYPNGGMTRGDIDLLARTRRLCMLGEFGNSPPVTPPPTPGWNDLVRYAKSKGWPVLGWAWNGDSTGSNRSPPQPRLDMNMVVPQFQPNIMTATYSKEPSVPSYFDVIYGLL